MKKIYIVILFLFLFVSGFSQRWGKRKYEFFYGIGASNFMGDIMAPQNEKIHLWVHLFNTVAPMANVGLRYNIEDRHYASATVSFGQFYAKETPGNSKYYYRGLKFSTGFLEIAARYEFLVLKERTRRTVYKKLGESKLKNFNVPIYLFVGLAGMVNGGTVTHNFNTTSESKNYISGAFAIPYGIGFKTKLKRFLYINLELGARFTLSDGIDYVKRNNFSNITGGHYFDQYGFITVNVIHKLGSDRKGLPKFKRH